MKKIFSLILLVLSINSFELSAQTTITLGTGTSSNTGTTVGPNNCWYRNYKMQILYKASEFNALGVSGQTWLNSIAWNVTGIPNSSFPNYTIKIGQIPATTSTLNNSIFLPNTGFTTVYTNANQTLATTGWNTLNFTTPYLWDGTSNIVVEVCWDIISPTYSSTGTTQSTNLANHLTYYRSDITPACPAPNPSFAFNSPPRPNAQFNISPYLLPCAGPPSAGVMTSFPPTPCVGKPFTLTLNGATQATNLVYNWQEALPSNPTAFTTITGSSTTQGFYSSSFTTPKWYRCIVTCPTNSISDTTVPIFVDSGQFWVCYCDPLFSTPNGAGYFIDTVGILNTPLAHGSSGKGPNGYQLVPEAVATCTLQQNSPYIITIGRSNQSSFNHKAEMWIDYDQSGTFDASEYTLIQNPFIGFIYNKSIFIPNNLPAGRTGMRIAFHSSSPNSDICNNPIMDGEVEDYTIYIDLPPCNNPSNAGTAFSLDSAICPATTFSVIDTGHDVNRKGLTYGWQFSTDGINWNTINGANSDTLNTTINVPTWFRFVVYCNGQPTYSNTTKVELFPSYACYCPSRSQSPSDYSDIGAVKFGNFVLQSPGGSHLLNPKSNKRYTSNLGFGPLQATMDSIYELAVYHVSKDSMHSDAKITVFIDYNRDGSYQSATERIYTGISGPTSYYKFQDVQIPSSASAGLTGFRVILNEDTGPNIPSDEGCGLYAKGETEDYLILLKDPPVTSVIDNALGINLMSLYPVPASGKLNYLINTSIKGEYQIKVSNLIGQDLILENVEIYENNFVDQIDVSQYPSGVYTFTITNQEGMQYSENFTVEH